MVFNLSPELGARGITINAIAPGGTATDMANTHALSYKHPLLDVPLDVWEKMHGALGRLARPEEIAAAPRSSPPMTPRTSPAASSSRMAGSSRPLARHG